MEGSPKCSLHLPERILWWVHLSSSLFCSCLRHTAIAFEKVVWRVPPTALLGVSLPVLYIPPPVSCGSLVQVCLLGAGLDGGVLKWHLLLVCFPSRAGLATFCYICFQFWFNHPSPGFWRVLSIGITTFVSLRNGPIHKESSTPITHAPPPWSKSSVISALLGYSLGLLSFTLLSSCL